MSTHVGQKAKKSIKVKVGPVEVEGPLGLVGSFALGYIFALGVIVTLRQPSFVIDRLISTQIPPLPRVINLSINQDHTPIYLLNPGERVMLKIEQIENKKLLWVFDHDPIELSLDTNPLDSSVIFSAPEKIGEQVSAVVCEADIAHPKCQSAPWNKTFQFQTSVGPR